MNPSKNRNVQVEIATVAQKEELSLLLASYLSELNQYTAKPIPEHVKIDYPYFDLYWTEEKRIPLLFKQEEQNIGFALVNDFVLSPPAAATISIAEFYIIPAFRKKGIGQKMANHIFKEYPGKWEIRELDKNEISQQFWRKVIGEFTGGEFKEITIVNGDDRFWVQLFES